MKRYLLIAAAAIIAFIGLTPVGFAQQKATPASPQYGGVLRQIASSGPRMLGYPPLMGPFDQSAIFPAGERLVDVSSDRQIEPVLAEKVDVDAKNLKITWHIRKGVKFHDGSDLDADVVLWNIERQMNNKTNPYAKYIKNIRVTDKFTLVIELTEYNNQLVSNWGRMLVLSKAAWEKASAGDLEKGKEWASTHVVGTGPFILKEFKRDDHLTWVRNPNYWRKGRPYLDGIDVRIIPDNVTASAMMQAKEADMWIGRAKDDADLMKNGLKRHTSWPAVGVAVWINTANPASKWQDKRLREAVEYALDKEAFVKAIGFGLYQPLKSLPPAGEWGYDPGYDPRPYNPQKAKALLADAGYASGLKTKLLVTSLPAARDEGVAIKQYLDAAGFQIDLDVADPGRFAQTMFFSPAGPDQDLAIYYIGSEFNYLTNYMNWFGSQSGWTVQYLGHTPEQAELDKQAMKLGSVKEQEGMTRKLVRYLTDNAFVIPLYNMPAAAMEQPWVHQPYPEYGVGRWPTEEIWMEKHK